MQPDPSDSLLKAYAPFTYGGSVSYLTHTPVPREPQEHPLTLFANYFVASEINT